MNKVSNSPIKEESKVLDHAYFLYTNMFKLQNQANIFQS